jgi:hypothetical protein
MKSNNREVAKGGGARPGTGASARSAIKPHTGAIAVKRTSRTDANVR